MKKILRKIQLLINMLINKFANQFFKNYDYTFLKERIYNTGKDYIILIVGLSYSLFGINEKLLKYKAINLSLPSQDLYYVSKIARKFLINNSSVRYCILGVSYYSFHFDLSKSKSEKNRIDNVYYPILNDSHNYKILRNCIQQKPNTLAKCTSTYFNKVRTRKLMSAIKYNLRNLNEKEMKNLGKLRAQSHNNLIQYKETNDENISVMENLVKYLNNMRIKPIILVCPCLEYYRIHLDSLFKRKFYENLKIIINKYDFEIIDLYDSSLFGISDYVDMDHLNNKGSIKVTEIINNRLNKII